MILRILGEGQFELDDAHHDALNELDDIVERAVADSDQEALTAALTKLLDRVRSLARPVPDDALVDSELILPDAGADLAELRRWLAENDASDGLIPG
ncbi:PspA-associated protein PspAA [Nigerium massiliense]|uniref:PspA-associated protein PspAA n=1 Tax=Nigerium massiliense TaxID=1522317 RepID=UPI00058F2EEE|nr:hypothetical protein [Nigerium massiliense]